MSETFDSAKDFAVDIATAPFRVFKDFKADVLSELGKMFVKEPTPEERALIDFAADLIRDTLQELGALTDERVHERAEKMGPDMVKVSKIKNLGSGAAGHHDKSAELVRLAETDDMHAKLAVIIHEFVHHLFIQIRKGRQWMGVDEGVVEGFTQYILKKNSLKIFEAYPNDVPIGPPEIPLEQRLKTFWQLRTSYLEQVDTMEHVMKLVAQREGKEYSEIQADFYRTFLGVLPFRDMAKRVEHACGDGALRLLRSMATTHQELGISRNAALRSVPRALITPTWNDPVLVPDKDTAMLQTYDRYEESALPNTGVPLVEQYKFMRRRFIIDAERIMKEGPPYNEADQEQLARTLRNVRKWREMHLKDAEDFLDDPHKLTADFRAERKAFKKQYDKHTRALVSQIRATLRDSSRLTREGHGDETVAE